MIDAHSHTKQQVVDLAAARAAKASFSGWRDRIAIHPAGERVRIASADGNNPILITDPEHDALLVIQMPCRISQAA